MGISAMSSLLQVSDSAIAIYFLKTKLFFHLSIRGYQTFPTNMTTSFTSSLISSFSDHTGTGKLDMIDDFAIQRWLGDTDGDRVARRLLVSATQSEHSPGTAGKQGQPLSIHEPENNLRCCKETCWSDLTGVGAWSYPDHLK